MTQAWEQIVMSGHAPNAISNRWTVEPLLAAGTAPEEITIEEAEEVMREADRCVPSGSARTRILMSCSPVTASLRCARTPPRILRGRCRRRTWRSCDASTPRGRVATSRLAQSFSRPTPSAPGRFRKAGLSPMGWRSSARALARIAARPVSAAVDGLDAQTAVAHGTVLCERPPRATDDDGGATFTKKSRQRAWIYGGRRVYGRRTEGRSRAESRVGAKDPQSRPVEGS